MRCQNERQIKACLDLYLKDLDCTNEDFCSSTSPAPLPFQQGGADWPRALRTWWLTFVQDNDTEQRAETTQDKLRASSVNPTGCPPTVPVQADRATCAKLVALYTRRLEAEIAAKCCQRSRDSPCHYQTLRGKMSGENNQFDLDITLCHNMHDNSPFSKHYGRVTFSLILCMTASFLQLDNNVEESVLHSCNDSVLAFLCPWPRIHTVSILPKYDSKCHK